MERFWICSRVRQKAFPTVFVIKSIGLPCRSPTDRTSKGVQPFICYLLSAISYLAIP